MRHNQRIAIAAGVGLAAALAVPVGSAHAISGGKAVSSAPWAVQVHNTDGVDDVELFRLAEPVEAPHIKPADTDPRKGAVVNI